LPADPLAAVRADLGVDVALDAALEGLPVQSVDATGRATVRIDNGRVEGRIDEGFAVNAVGVADIAEGVRVPEVALAFGAPLTASIGIGGGDWRLAVPRVDVALPDVHAAGQRLSFRRARLEELAVASRAGELTATTRLRTRSAKDALAWMLDGRVASNGNSGGVRVAAEGRVTRALLKAELGGYKSAYDLDAGSLAASFDGAWRRRKGALTWTGQGRVALADGVAHAGETTLSGVAFDVPLVFAADGVRAGPAHVAAAAVDVGVPLGDIGADVHVTPTQVLLTGVGAALLGGRAAVDRIEYPFAGPGTSFDLRLEGLSLADVLALEGEDIAGEGIVDATLPVRIEGGALTIADGRVAARPPGGAIRYRGSVGAAARATPGLGLALDALADFNFSRLDADANYAADGTLALLVRLQGRNPAVEKGRPIHFNLNVTENIPTLLRALRAGDAVTERVQEQFAR
jgi:hypothetical protein